MKGILFLKSRSFSLKSRIPSGSAGEGSIYQRGSEGIISSEPPHTRSDRDPSLRFGVTEVGFASGLWKSLALMMAMLISIPTLAEDKGTLPLPSSGNVTLTLTEYDRLTDLATKAAKKHEAPPVAYTIKHADVKLHVSNGTVLGTVVEEGEVFSKGAAKVPLTSGLTIFNARQQGKPLPLFEEGSMATAVLPGATEFSVALEAGLPLNIEAGRASFSLPAPAAGSVKLAVVIPGDHSNVRISPGLITGRTSLNGQTIIEATLQPGQPASIWWQTREIAAPTVPKEVRFLSDVKTLVSVGEA